MKRIDRMLKAESDEGPRVFSSDLGSGVGFSVFRFRALDLRLRRLDVRL